MTKKLTVAELSQQVLALVENTIIATPKDVMDVAQLGAAVHIFSCSRMRAGGKAKDEAHALLLRGCMWLLDSDLPKVGKTTISDTDENDELTVFTGVLGAAMYDRCQNSEDTLKEDIFSSLFATACGTYTTLYSEELGDSVLDDKLLAGRIADVVEGLAVEVAQRLDTALEDGPSDAS